MHHIYYLAALIDQSVAHVPMGESFQIKNVLNAVYFWSGALAVIVIIAGGFFYITSLGDASKVKRAKDAILYAVIGLGVVLLAFAITSIVMKGVDGR